MAANTQTIELVDPDTFQPWESREGYIGVAETRTGGILDADVIDPERVDLVLSRMMLPGGNLTVLSRQ